MYMYLFMEGEVSSSVLTLQVVHIFGICAITTWRREGGREGRRGRGEDRRRDER